MAKNNIEFVEFLKTAYNEKWAYCYGCTGVKFTKSLYDYKCKQYPKHYTPDRAAEYKKRYTAGVMATDCVGLVKSYMWNVNGVQKYKANDFPDVSANGLFDMAKVKGPINTIPEKPGVAVRYDGHVGYYIGNGEVIEARGFAYGVVKTKLKERKWTHWYEIPVMNYITEKKENTVVTKEPDMQIPENNLPVKYVVLKPGVYSVNVRADANTNAKIIDGLQRGGKMKYGNATASNGWFKVWSTKANTWGWITNKYCILED